MLGELKTRRPELLESVRRDKEVTPEVDKALVEFLDGFVKTFA
jgi:hypothetical protein